MTQKHRWSLWMLCGLLLVGTTAQATLKTYTAPAVQQNTYFTVQVREEGGAWQDLFEYNAQVGRPTTYYAAFVYFDADFAKRIEIKATDNIHRYSNGARIRPLSYNIPFTLSDSNKTITFFLDKPRKISVEFTNDMYRNLQVFANPLESNPPKQGDAGVTYYGPGLHTPGQITLTANQTVYIAGGAVVRGTIKGSSVNNVKVLGRGILDASTSTGRVISLNNCSNVSLEGIIITNAQQWCIVPTACDHVTITNIKEMSHVIYSDGIDPVSSQYVTIDDCFIRNGDDCISIKASGSETNHDIIIRNCVFWSDAAHGILIGPEGNGTTTEKVTFINNDILEINCTASQWWGAMAITNGANQTIRNVTFQDVRVENFTAGDLVNIRIEQNQYVSAPGGCVKNITFKNITYNGNSPNLNIITGYDAGRYVDSLTFENVRINGNLVLSAAAGNFQIGSYVNHVVFKAGTTGLLPARPAAGPEGLAPGPVVYDMAGRVVMEQSALPSGIYFRELAGNLQKVFSVK